ncbi:MAG: carbon-nitrogen hydrolase family protein [Christensenellales bacterium]|jgi:predicted amidohydrolase
MNRKARIASFGLNEDFLRGKNQREIIPIILDKVETVRGYRPDLIVFPEAFLKIGGDVGNPDWIAITEEMLDGLSKKAKELECYIVAPVYEQVIEHPELKYNSTMLINRKGEIVGKYRKVHTVVEESTVSHVLPGNEYPVFDTDFGRIGIQTCFDIGWREGWKILADKGAQLVIWTAAYDGGNLLNTYAAYNMYFVVSSVRTDHARIIDPTGRTIAEGARWNGLAMADIDLETTIFHIDRQFKQIEEIRKALGDKVLIKAYSEENIFTIESFDADWPVSRITKEFGLISYKDYHTEATALQDEWRKRYPTAP